MAKHLSVILKQYSDVISGKLPASKVAPLKTGDLPGVDYAGKMPDERDFVASHSVEKHADRNGNGDDLFNAANIGKTEQGRHGHIPSPTDVKVYQKANEEVDLSKVTMNKKTGKLSSSDPKIDLSKVTMNKKTGKLSYNENFEQLNEREKPTHQNPLVTVHDKDGLATHNLLSVANDIHNTKVKAADIHKGEVKVTGGHDTKKALRFKLSKHHASEVKEEIDLEEKYSGFEKTKKALAAKGAKDPAALAAWIGRKKYGKEKFQKAAAEGKKLKEAKDEGEYGYEGEMAMSQIKSIMNHSSQLMKILKPDSDLPEWVQSKITLAADYIQTAADYYATEISEASKCNMSEAGTMCEVHGNKSCPTEETETASDKEPRYNGKKKEGRQLITDKKNIQEKAESVAQQKLMGMALAYKRGEMPEASEEVKKLASSMSEKQLRDFAKTKHSGLPQHVQKEQAPAPTPITFPVTNSREGFKL